MRGAGAGRPELEPLLRRAVERGASDLHLRAGTPPTLRVDGRLAPDPDRRELTGEETAAIARSLLPDARREELAARGAADVALAVAGLARFRCHVFRQRGEVALAIRAIPHEVPDFGELGLPDVVPSLARHPRGLALVTGPTGSGKSTTLAAVLDRVNRERSGHIVTVEDPIEFVHRPRRCLVSQREVGGDSGGFPEALRAVLRQDADVVLVGEMRDVETVRAALAVAETGHLTLATLHTNSAAETVNRIVDVFPAREHGRVRSQLAAVLLGVVTQVLLPRADGAGRLPACEVMTATPAVRSLIREGKEHQLPSALQTGRRHGMRTLDDSLRALHHSGAVSRGACLAASPDPDRLARRMSGGSDAEAGRAAPGAPGERGARRREGEGA